MSLEAWIESQRGPYRLSWSYKADHEAVNLIENFHFSHDNENGGWAFDPKTRYIDIPHGRIRAWLAERNIPPEADTPPDRGGIVWLTREERIQFEEAFLR